MPSKDDDNLDPVPSMSATRGERASSAQARKATSRPAAGPTAKKAEKSSGGLLPSIALAGVVVLAGAFIWQNMQLSKALEDANQQRQQAEQRIAALEELLSSSNDEMGENAAAVAAKLKWADSEIRKLWGVAHDRNRKAIASNKDRIANTEARLKKLNSQVSATSKTASALDASVKKNTTNAREAIQRLGLAQETLNDVESSISAINNRLRKLESSQASGANKAEIAALKESVDSLEKWRLSTNRELNSLRASLGPAGI